MKRIAFTMVSACLGSAASAATVVNTDLAMAYIGNTNRLIQESNLKCSSEVDENPHLPRVERTSSVRIVTVNGTRVLVFVNTVNGVDANGRPQPTAQTRTITTVVPSADGESVIATSQHSQRLQERFSGKGFTPRRELRYITTAITSCH